MNESLSLLGLSTTPLEVLSFVLSIATVWLNIRQNHWAWLFAILSSAMYGLVFFESKLYGDMGLQLVFITVSVWGWYQWLHGDDTHERLPVTALAWFLMAFTDTDVPFADGFLTAGSLVGQLLLSRKKLENWHVWIIVDVLYVALYVHKGLMLTAVLYGLFVVMATIGLLAWRKSMLADAPGNQPASESMVLR